MFAPRVTFPAAAAGLFLVGLLHPAMLTADDMYIVRTIQELEYKDPADSGMVHAADWNQFIWREAARQFAYARMNVEGEIHLVLHSTVGDPPAETLPRRVNSVRPQIAIRVDAEIKTIDGTLYLPMDFKQNRISSSEPVQLRAFPFSLDLEKEDPQKSQPTDGVNSRSQQDFDWVKHERFQDLWQADLPGAAWFRFQANEAAKLLERTPDPPRDNFNQWQQTVAAERTMALISGGRAVSENLQLDRALQMPTEEDDPNLESVALSSLPGITVREFDWTKLNEGKQPELDALARLIPADQHALFLPSFDALVSLLEFGFDTAGPLPGLFGDDITDTQTRQRYHQQLGLPLDELQKIFGPLLIENMAITGGDPYFRTGTDVAVIFQAKDSKLLKQSIESLAARQAETNPDAKQIEGVVQGVAWTGYRSSDRVMSTHIAELGDAIVVANSEVQLERIIHTGQGTQAPFSELPEYVFFRDRYPNTDDSETALLVIPDQAIRRWCGPRWRIATQRRTEATAEISDMHARYLDEWVEKTASPPVTIEMGSAAGQRERFKVTDDAVLSPTYGTLEFQTPVAELEFDMVTKSEAEAYQNWRTGYQRNWNGAFDPIAVQLKLQSQRLEVDLSIMPLIQRSDYNRWKGVSEGALLDVQQLDVHDETLIHGVLALNPKSSELKQWTNMLNTFLRINIMDWLGDSIEVYVDDSDLWDDVAAAVADGQRAEEVIGGNAHRLPVAIRIDSKNSLKLTAFVVAARAWIEQSAPDMTVWETRRHRDKAYVCIRPSEEAKQELPPEQGLEEIAVYYLVRGDGLTLSLDESVIQRAIERIEKRESDAARHSAVNQTADGNAKAGSDSGGEDNVIDSTSTDPKRMELLGRNVAVHIRREFAIAMLAMWSTNFENRMQLLSWTAIPILNEWKLRYPDQDPVELDRRVWKRHLRCPGGGEYRWNEEWHTMESTVYGHPGQHQAGRGPLELLGKWTEGSFGLTFEHDGLRSRLKLTEAPIR